MESYDTKLVIRMTHCNPFNLIDVTDVGSTGLFGLSQLNNSSSKTHFLACHR